jgi:hypothetical protein
VLPAEQQLAALEAAIKTMRRTDCYGLNEYSIDFEWPKPADLLQMANKIQIKIKNLNYKKSSYSGCLSAIQI